METSIYPPYLPMKTHVRHAQSIPNPSKNLFRIRLQNRPPKKTPYCQKGSPEASHLGHHFDQLCHTSHHLVPYGVPGCPQSPPRPQNVVKRVSRDPQTVHKYPTPNTFWSKKRPLSAVNLSAVAAGRRGAGGRGEALIYIYIYIWASCYTLNTQSGHCSKTQGSERYRFYSAIGWPKNRLWGTAAKAPKSWTQTASQIASTEPSARIRLRWQSYMD